jgi:hypothetical protein
VLLTAFPLPLSLQDVQGGIPIPRFCPHIPKFTDSLDLQAIHTALWNNHHIPYLVFDPQHQAALGLQMYLELPTSIFAFYYQASWGGV